jgi:hypothetical protein
MSSLAPGFPLFRNTSFFIEGMILSWISGTELGITTGNAKDDTDVNTIIMSNSVIINTDNVGANGLDNGVMEIDTYYAVYVIGNSTSNNPNVFFATGTSGNQFSVGGTGRFVNGAGLLSKNLVRPVLPVGFDMFRRIGFVRTETLGTDILNFVQEGRSTLRKMWYAEPIPVLVAGVQAGFTTVDLTDALPFNGSVSSVIMTALITPTAASNSAQLKPGDLVSTDGLVSINGVVAGVQQQLQVICPCTFTPNPAAMEIEYKVVGILSLNVNGYQDNL